VGFCLLSFTFISLPAYRQAGSAAVVGGHSNEFPACSNTQSLYATQMAIIIKFKVRENE